MANRLFLHNKTGDTYELLFIAIECTNARVGHKVDYPIGNSSEGKVAAYRKYNGAEPQVYVRDYSEFLEKFTEI